MLIVLPEFYFAHYFIDMYLFNFLYIFQHTMHFNNSLEFRFATNFRMETFDFFITTKNKAIIYIFRVQLSSNTSGRAWTSSPRGAR